MVRQRAPPYKHTGIASVVSGSRQAHQDISDDIGDHRLRSATAVLRQLVAMSFGRRILFRTAGRIGITTIYTQSELTRASKGSTSIPRVLPP